VQRDATPKINSGESCERTSRSCIVVTFQSRRRWPWPPARQQGISAAKRERP
jgi:hypothetical protein